MISSKMPVSFQMDSEVITSTKPAYETSEETGNNDRKRKDQGNGKTGKRSGKITRNSSSKKKAEEQVICTMKVTKQIT